MRKKYKKNKKNNTDEKSHSLPDTLLEVDKPIEPVSEANQTSESYNQKHLFEKHSQNDDYLFEEIFEPKKNEHKFIKKMGCFLAGIALLLIIWFFIFPFIINTSFVNERLKLILGNKFNVKVETGSVKFSNWGKKFEIHASAVSLLDLEDGSVVAYADEIDFKLSPLYIFYGEKCLQNVKINSVDIPFPLVSIQKYMLSKGYLSHSFLDNYVKYNDDSMSFQNIDVKISPNASKLKINAVGDCEINFFKNTAFEFIGIYDLNTDHLKIDCFHLWGNRSIDMREIKDNNIVKSIIETPVRVVVAGEITENFIDLPEIQLMVDLCQAILKFKKTKTNLIFNINVDNQNFPNAGKLFNTRSRNETLEGVCLNVEARAISGKELISGGNISVKKGALRGVPFENANLEFSAVNDKFTDFNAAANLWNGFANINLNERTLNRQNYSQKNLKGNIFAFGIDLNNSFSDMEKMPALAGGELTLDFDFDFENLGIGEFLSKNLPDFKFDTATGSVILSNAYLSHFSNQEWLTSSEIPKLIKDYFGIAANITESTVSIPLLNKFIKKLALNKPRTFRSSVVIKNGQLSTPEVFADTPVGELIAKGSSNSNNVMEYILQLKLNEEIFKKYSTNPVLALFRKNEIIQLPIILSGEIGKPDVKLNLMPEKRAELENRLTEIIAEKLEKTMKKRDPDFKKSDKLDARIKNAIQSIIKKLL